jgi:hypothetical protein
MNLQESRDLLSQLAAQDNDNPVLRWQAMVRDIRIMQIRLRTEPSEGLWPAMRAQRQDLDSFYLAGKIEDFDASVEYAGALIDYSQLARHVDRSVEADHALKEANDRLSRLVNENPDRRSSRHLLAYTWLEHWNLHGTLPSDEASEMLDGYLVNPERATSCDDASLAARLALISGNISLAKDYTLYLLSKGFYEPGFVAFCKRNDLCEM